MNQMNKPFAGTDELRTLCRERLNRFKQKCRRQRFAQHTGERNTLDCRRCMYRFQPGDDYFCVGRSPFYCRECINAIRLAASALIFEVPLVGVPEPVPFRGAR